MSNRLRRSHRAGLLLASLGLLLAACSSHGSSQPDQTSSAAAATDSTSASASPSVSLPPRPKEINLNGIQPCDLLTQQQREQLGLDQPPLPAKAPAFHVPTCSIGSDKNRVATSVMPVPNKDLTYWFNKNEVNADPQVIQIAGFPALLDKTPGRTNFCNVDVGVAQGQFLDVMYRENGAKPPPSLDSLCDGAKQVATAAMQSLLNKG
jgi:Protein of unknown function (DUF3558)